MTTAADQFFAYAADFEETYRDDNWDRLRPYFHEDAVYEVVGGPLACRIEGVDAILAGLKKSIDGLDRQCDSREIEVTGGPQVETGPDGDTVRLAWKVSYTLGDAPLASLPGKSVVRLRDGRIFALQDQYDEMEVEPFVQWLETHAPHLDGAYV